MQRNVRPFVSVLALFLILGLKASAEDAFAGVAKQQEPYTVTVALEFSKKNMNPVMRLLSMTDALGANGHATGFLVGDGLVMTSYHVVGGNLSARKRELLGFKSDDELEVSIYVNGCQAKVVKVDPDADLALLRACTPHQKQQPTFRSVPSADEPLFLIAQPGEQKMIRRGTFNGLYTLGNASYLSVKIDGQDGFSGSPVYDANGEIVGIFSLYDWGHRTALLSTAARAQQFLADYER